VEIRILHFEGCPNTAVAVEHVRAAVAGRDGITVVSRLVRDPEDAEREGMRGSPTILIDGVDPFADEAGVVWACRRYPTADGPAGAPTIDAIRDAMSRA
jgi:hypothetical protein